MSKSATFPSPICSWADLASLIEQCSDTKFIFRGEPNASYTLKPRAGRFDTRPGAPLKVPYDRVKEEEAFELFKRQARPYIGHTPASNLEWLAIAQHHDMPTRLLDWTESLLVAAYFATERAGTLGDAVIYAVRGLRRVPKSQEDLPFRLRTAGVYRPPPITPRIPAQRSVFTIHPDPTSEFQPKGLTRWVISANACAKIKRILDACAINESSLFPDLVGLSRYVAWRYKWGKF